MTKEDLPQHLTLCDTRAFNIFRKGKVEKYTYWKNSKPIKDKKLISQLNNYGIPATWTEVSLSADDKSHILATGYDGSGKLQYLYHPDYLEHANSRKFEDLVEFAQALPRIRRRVAKDLKSTEWNERKLLALIVRILDKYHMRIGSRVYASKKQSYGLTTLRKKHLQEHDEELVFKYQGKSHQEREVHLTDPLLVENIRELAGLPGWDLFSFKNGNSTIKADSKSVNNYIREISGGDFTARNFRTWGGTTLSVKLHPVAQKIIDKNPRKEFKATLVQAVAAELGNTPAICREYYIHPKVLEHTCADGFDCAPCKNLKGYRKYECRTLELLTS